MLPGLWDRSQKLRERVICIDVLSSKNEISRLILRPAHGRLLSRWVLGSMCLAPLIRSKMLQRCMDRALNAKNAIAIAQMPKTNAVYSPSKSEDSKRLKHTNRRPPTAKRNAKMKDCASGYRYPVIAENSGISRQGTNAITKASTIATAARVNTRRLRVTGSDRVKVATPVDRSRHIPPRPRTKAQTIQKPCK